MSFTPGATGVHNEPMTHRLLAVLTLLAAWSAAASGLRVALADEPVYTEAQAGIGRALYLDHCAACHAEDLGGTGDPPALAGRDFVASWRARTTKDLIRLVQTMPPGGPALAADQSLAVAAFILQQNGAKAGDQPLTNMLVVPIGLIATGERPLER